MKVHFFAYRGNKTAHILILLAEVRYTIGNCLTEFLGTWLARHMYSVLKSLAWWGLPMSNLTWNIENCIMLITEPSLLSYCKFGISTGSWCFSGCMTTLILIPCENQAWLIVIGDPKLGQNLSKKTSSKEVHDGLDLQAGRRQTALWQCGSLFAAVIFARSEAAALISLLVDAARSCYWRPTFEFGYKSLSFPIHTPKRRGKKSFLLMSWWCCFLWVNQEISRGDVKNI